MPLILTPSGSPASGVLRWEWVDPTGVTRDLTGETSPNLFVMAWPSGLGVPPIAMTIEKLPMLGGGVARPAAIQPREIELPIHASAASLGALELLLDNVRAWFDTGDERRRAPGYLRVTRPSDDEVRRIACYYVGGLEGEADAESAFDVDLVVSLIAPDPAWTAADEIEATYTQADILAQQAILNLGDFDAYPIWTITGPASTIVLSNQTTNKAMVFTANGGLSLTTGEELTIDTRPPSLRSTLAVVDGDGTPHSNKLAAQSALWHFVPGQNNFTVSAVGTSADTRFNLRWLPRYRGVLR